MCGHWSSAFGAPVIAWLLFATLYYGFPLPNTYYAKVATGIPSSLLYRQGLAYVLNSVWTRSDHPGNGRDRLSAGAPIARRRSSSRAASALLYVAYTVSVGGDFMSGRFFALPFLVSVVALSPMLEGATFPRLRCRPGRL